MKEKGKHISFCPKLAFISILFLIAFTPVCAQSGKLLFHHLRLEDGMSDLTNAWVYKDTRGFVWISSIRGLNRFDGMHVKNYFPDSGDSTALRGENIQSSFFEDKNADLWFCTYEAIHRYDRKSDSFEPFTMLEDDSTDIVGYHIFHFDKEENLWMLIEKHGVYTFNIRSKVFQEIANISIVPRRGIALEGERGNVRNVLLYTVDDPGIIQLNLDEDQRMSDSIHLLHGAVKNLLIPNKILLDEQGRLWIAGRDELVEYDLKQKIFTHTAFPGILSIGDLDSATLLVAVDEAGVWEYDKNEKWGKHQYLPEFTNTASLLSSKINMIERDKDGGCWIASWGIGLSYAYPEKRKFYIHAPLVKSDPGSPKFNPNGFFELDNGHVLASTEYGLFELDRKGNIISQWEAPDNMVRERFNSLHSVYIDVRKNIWLSTYSGLSVLSPDGKFTHVTDRRNVMFFGLQLMDGRLIYSGRNKGLYEIEYLNGKYGFRQINPNLDKEYMIAGQDQRGTIWLTEGLQRLILLDPFSLNPIDTLPVGGIIRRFIHQAETNTIWIAGSNGLHEIDDRTYQIREVYNEDNLLPCAGVSGMLMDERGIFWISCRNNIMAFNPAAKTTEIFGQEDGMPGSSFTDYGAYQFKDGEMWFGSVSGIMKFYPDNLHKIKTQAIPQITTLLINDNIPRRDLICKKSKATHITEIEQLTFSYKESTLTFLVNSLEYSAPSKNKIRYKMEGLDPEWIETTNGSYIRYANLPPRSFTFMVSAANSDGEYSPYIRKIALDIKPPFYKTWWFITLSVLSLSALVFYIFYINFLRKLEVQNVRLKLYENLHDDVGSRLMAIVMSADAMLQDSSANPKLQLIASIARGVVGNMRRLIWAIDPENESMNSMLDKIRHDKSQIIDEKIQFHLNAPPELRDKVVPGEVRYQVTSIINESLNNISKYAEAQNVWVEFSKSGGSMHVMIRDDGKGFQMDETGNDKVRGTGYGMGNMQKRAARIKASLTVDSHPGQGTRIDIIIPFS